MSQSNVVWLEPPRVGGPARRGQVREVGPTAWTIELEEGRRLEARAARSVQPPPMIGDEVLLLADAGGSWYIVDVLSGDRPHDPPLAPAPAPAPAGTRTEQLCDGSSLRVEGNSAGLEALHFTSADGKLEFEYDAATSRCRLRSRAALDVEDLSGDLRFRSKGNVHFEAEGDVSVAAGRAVRLQSRAADGSAGLELEPQQVRLHGERLSLEAEHSRLISARTDAEIGAASLRARRLRLVATSLESVCDDVVQRAKNAFLQIRDTWNVRAGRSRTVIEGTAHQSSKRYVCRGTEEIKMKSDKIHLA